MASSTPNYALRKPATSDRVSVVTDLNENFDKIDAHTHTGTYVLAAGTTAGAPVIVPTNAATVPFTVRGAASQTGDLQQWQNSAGTALALINAGGLFKSTSVLVTYVEAGAQTGPYLVLSGGSVIAQNRTDIAAVPLVVKGMASQSGDLQQWQNSTGAVLTKIDAVGKLGIDPWNGVPGSIPANASLFVGPANASSVGVAIRGVASQSGDLQQWQNSAGTVLAKVRSDGLIAAPVITNAADNGPYFDFGQFGMIAYNRGGVSNVPLTIKGMASQSGDLQQWQNSAGASVAWVRDYGGLGINYINSPANAGPFIDMASFGSVVVINRTNVSNVPFTVKGMAGQTGDLQQWQDSTGFQSYSGAEIKSDGSFRSKGGTFEYAPYGTFEFGDIDGIGIKVAARQAAQPVLRVQGAVAQTGDLQQWRDSAGAVLARVDPAGNMTALAYGVPAGGTLAISGTDTYIQLTGGSVAIRARTNVANIPLWIRGMAGQTGDLQQWQNSGGTVFVKVKASGELNVSGAVETQYVTDLTNTGPYVQTSTSSLAVFNRTTVSNVALLVKGMAGQTGDLQQWQDSAGTALARVDAAGGLSVAYGLVPQIHDATITGPYISMNNNAIVVTNRTTAGNVPLVVKGMAGQTGDLQQWQNSGGTPVAFITAGGLLRTGGLAGATSPSIVVADGAVLVFSAGTGTKIGSAPSEKMAFYGSTPTTRPTGVAVTAAGIHAALVSLGLIAA